MKTVGIIAEYNPCLLYTSRYLGADKLHGYARPDDIWVPGYRVDGRRADAGINRKIRRPGILYNRDRRRNGTGPILGMVFAGIFYDGRM